MAEEFGFQDDLFEEKKKKSNEHLNTGQYVAKFEDALVRIL
jgi:hypothetical protein